MTTGKLRWRVRLESPVYPELARTGQKNLPSSWTPVGTYWAEVRTPTGREALVAQQKATLLTHVVTIRYRPEVRSTWRFVYKGRHLNILWVNNVDGRDRQLDVWCQETAQ